MPAGDVPVLDPGENQIELTCEAGRGPPRGPASSIITLGRPFLTAEAQRRIRRRPHTVFWQALERFL